MPFAIGLSLTTSAVAAGLAGRSLGHSIVLTNKLAEQFQLAVEASAECLASPQRQITPRAEDAFQNCCALDLLTAEKGGLFLRKNVAIMLMNLA